MLSRSRFLFKLKSLVQGSLSKQFVYPNYYPIPMSSDGSIIEAANAMEPSGLLKLKLLSAQDLKRTDVGFVGGSSDPYAVIRQEFR